MDSRSGHRGGQVGTLEYVKIEKLRRKCKRFWSSYRCHRLRNKTHFQITLDLLAKLIQVPAVSTRLRRISLECHGIRNDLKPADVLSRRGMSEQAVQRGDLFCGRFFLDVQDDQLWATYRSQFGNKIQEVIEDAEIICRHEFDLLGSGILYWGHPIDWHLDPVSGYRWPKKFYTEIQQGNNSS